MPRLRYLLAGLGVPPLLAFAALGAAWLLSPAPGPFTAADVDRLGPGMTLADVEALFGPPMADAQSGLTPRSDQGGFWKAWKGEAYDLHVEFDAEERFLGALLHPRAPVRLQRFF